MSEHTFDWDTYGQHRCTRCGLQSIDADRDQRPCREGARTPASVADLRELEARVAALEERAER